MRVGSGLSDAGRDTGTVEMTYLLDASACVDYLRRPDSVLRPWISLVGVDAVRLCSVVQGELLVGIRKRPTKRNIKSVREFMAQFRSFPYDAETAEIYADIRADLERRGQVIGPYDMMIASVAVTHGATLVTGNQDEFQRVPLLKCLSLEDIAAEKPPF